MSCMGYEDPLTSLCKYLQDGEMEMLVRVALDHNFLFAVAMHLLAMYLLTGEIM